MTSRVSLQLFALTARGPVELAVDANGGTVHDILDRLPGGVYSALRTFGHNRFLWLDAHFDRTDRSMTALGWEKRLDRVALRAALHEVASAYPLADSRVRFDVLRDEFEIQGVRAATFLALSPYEPVPEPFLREGVRVEFAPHLHREAPRVKTTQFTRVRKPLPYGTKERYEHLMLDEQGRILECSSANVAFVRNGALLSAGDGVLEGITALVLRRIATGLGLAWTDERLSRDALNSVDVAFLTSSTRGVVPIVDIADTKIGDGRVGPITRRLVEAYYDYAEREARPAVESGA